jgi:histidinol-phosphate aminotransferase
MTPQEEALRLVRRAIRGMEGYVPGLQPGPGQQLVKLNTNENPFPPSPRVLEALHAAADGTLRLYPSPDAAPLREQAARTYGLSPSQVLAGNGSDEILAMIMRTFVDRGDSIAAFEPSYSLYPVLARMSGARFIPVPLPRPSAAADPAALPVPAPRAQVFFLTTPNAPYGAAFPAAWTARLLERFHGIVVADEAYVDFGAETALPLLADSPRLLIVRTLSKSYALAGMRVGLALGHEALIRELMKVKDSYNVSRPAQAAGCAALADDGWFRSTRDAVLATRERFSTALRTRGYTVLPSQANFVFVVPPQGVTAASLYDRLLSRGYLVRHLRSPAVSDGLRISIGTDTAMDALAAVMAEEAGRSGNGG